MWNELDKRVKKLDTLDIALTKWAVLFAAIIIIKLLPQLLDINYLILVVIVIALSARPLYKFWA